MMFSDIEPVHPRGVSKSEFPIGLNVHTPAERHEMFARMGISSVEDLLSDIPQTVRLDRALQLPQALEEWELEADVRDLANRNETTHSRLCFLGSGAYHHHVPAVIDAIVSRGEFLTAYTPYQPEMSQGLLQALYEFQSLMAVLVGLPHVNCSVYDGATAFAEACWMMCSSTGKRKVAVSQAIWSDYQDVLKAYLEPRKVEIVAIAQHPETGEINLDALSQLLSDHAKDIAGVALQTPNALGIVDSIADVSSLCKVAGVLLCVGVYPHLCGLLESPGQLGADIVTCEGQSLGLPLNAGGPYIGIIATTKPLERYLPGRLVGRVHDINGRLGYALIKEDREQHVARDKATSHICSNQALNAIRVAIYLSLRGGQNFIALAQQNAARAEGLRSRLITLSGISLLRSGYSFNEFALTLPVPAQSFIDAMDAQGIYAGVAIKPELAGHDRGILIAVTEMLSDADINRYIAAAEACLKELK